jgi:drug/metabolite transporter (DMT)-like permease
MILLIGYVISWSIGSAVSHKLDLPKNALVSTAFQLLFAGAIGFIISIFTENPFGGLPIITVPSFIALLYLILFGSIAMLGYVYLLKYEPLSRISTYAFINPIGATLLGLLFGEKLTPYFFIAMPLILVAILIILNVRVKEPHMETEGEK